MKRILLAATIAGLASPASAQGLPVYDNLANLLHLQELTRWGQQIQNGVQQLQTAEQTYQTFTHISSVGGAMSALGMLGIHNPLPINVGAAQALMSGRGGAGGMAASLQGLVVGNASANQSFHVPGASWVAQEINQTAGGIAGTQSMAMQGYTTAGQLSDRLAALQTQYASVSDPSTRADLANNIAIVQAQIQAQGVQIAAVQTYGQQALAAREQRQTEQLQKSISAELADGCSHGIQMACQ